MRCQTHANQDIEFVCTCSTCDYLTLCQECRKLHINNHKQDKLNHISFITPLIKILEQAEDNLRKQKKKLLDIIQPFKQQAKIKEDIQDQKNSLRKQCQRIKAEIDQLFISQINKLDSLNNVRSKRSNQDIPLQQLSKKVKEIQQLQLSFRQNSNKLKKSVVYSIEDYLRHLGRTKNALTSIDFYKSNEYYLYDQTKHQFYISKLQPKKKSISGKPLTKVFNQSPLYLLINKSTSDLLFYFSASQKLIRTYNVKRKKWKSYHAPPNVQISSFASSIHDPDTNRFYLFGGMKYQGNAMENFVNIMSRGSKGGGNKKSDIVCFDLKEKQWSLLNTQLITPRSSAMCVLIKKQKPQQLNKILIVGGLDEKGVALKSCQLFTPSESIKEDYSYIERLNCQTNFASSSGTLVNFNNNIIIKLGGLGNFENQHAICEMAQKLDFQKYRLNPNVKWNYIQIQDVLGHKQSDYKLFYASQSAIQINPNQIFVFGGCTHNNQGTRQSYIIQVQTITNPQGKTSNRYYARMINEKPLLTGQGFGDLKPVLWQGKLFTLQNISPQGNPNAILEKQKRILQFNMFEWFETDCIITE